MQCMRWQCIGMGFNVLKQFVRRWYIMLLYCLSNALWRTIYVGLLFRRQCKCKQALTDPPMDDLCTLTVSEYAQRETHLKCFFFFAEDFHQKSMKSVRYRQMKLNNMGKTWVRGITFLLLENCYRLELPLKVNMFYLEAKVWATVLKWLIENLE